MSQRTSETNKLYLRRLIWEARDGHTHARRADQAGDEDEEVLMVPGQVRPHLLRDGDEQDTRDRVADERRDNLRGGNSVYSEIMAKGRGLPGRRRRGPERRCTRRAPLPCAGLGRP